ncbi:MAG TPA: PAS domain-containing protein [Kofleriaceae bacterium]
MGVALPEYVQALVYTNVNDVIFHLRVEGERFRFLHINRAFTRATGLTEQQVVGRFVDEVIPEPSRTLVINNYRRAIAERRTVRWEEVTPYPTGTKVGEVSITPVIEPNGQCFQLIGTVSDITEVRLQQEAIRIYADIVRAVNIGLSTWTVGDPNDVDSIRLAACNQEAERMAGVDLSSHIGKPLLELLPALRGSELVAMIADVARDGEKRERDGVPSTLHRARVASIKAFPLPGGSVGVAVQDVTTRVRATRLQAGERRALEMLAAGLPLQDILTAIVRMIEELQPGTIASILLLDESGTHLLHGAAPGMPDAFNRAIDGALISDRGGSCGTAAFRGEAVYVEDIRTDPLWQDYRELAAMTDRRACWSTPIFGNDRRVIGTFALYDKEPGLPNEAIIELLERATHIAAIVLERSRLDEALRALPARIEAVREEERTGIARELHDELGQAMTALKMDIAWLGRRTRDNAELTAKLTEMSTMTDEVIQSVRRISAELRPGMLDDLGLAATIEWQASEFGSRTGIATRVDNQLAHIELDRAVATAVFRIFQEALTNIARHARAHHVDVSLRAHDGRLQLDVADDGVGLTAGGGRAGSLGLLGMRERARRLGGDCVITSRDPHGTLVSLSVPLPP